MTRLSPDLSGVTVVVLSHNREDIIGKNLQLLVSMAERTGCEVVVVDNASTDTSVELIQSALANLPNARFIRSDKNLGAAQGRNVGWREASREFILSIDDDTLVDAESIEQMLRVMRQSTMLAVSSPAIVHAVTGERQFYFADSNYRPAGFHEACHLVRRSALETIGLYDEQCSFGGEGLDLSIRARAAGFDVGYVGNVTVSHHNFPRSGDEGLNRRERWVYGFARLHHKHFKASVAALFSLRYLMSHLVSGVRTFGVQIVPVLVKAAWLGRRDGLRAHKLIPEGVERFYLDQSLKPDMGNVPIWKKVLRRL